MMRTDRRDFLKKVSLGTAALSLLPAGASASVPPAPPAGGLRYRQVHLDFHTSPLVTGIGADFDPDHYARQLSRARVNSVTSFVKCCHGYFYYQTELFPERRHPHLTRNLLKEQIDACHKQGIRVPLYTVIQWDAFCSRTQADWLMLDQQGLPVGTPQNEPGFYRFLCINTGLSDFTRKYIADVFHKVPVDGWFIDILMEKTCYCPACVKGMEALKLDPLNPRHAEQFSQKLFRQWKQELTAYIHSLDKDCPVFYNTGHIGPYIRRSLASYSHLELESLPSGEWGYLHLPLTARYARTLGKDLLGMTGKFHTAWGDFHSLKNQAALEFECFSMLALNTRCSIGDQLHPGGRLDQATYDLIGSVYRSVEQKEPWCQGAVAVADIGVLNPEEFLQYADRVPVASKGVVRMLQEGHHQFDVIDTQADFSRYKVLVLPDVVTVDEVLKAKLESYLAAGGGILASYHSGLTPDKKAFSADWGVEYVGDAPYSPDFVLPGGELGRGLPATELVMYLKGLEVKPTAADTLLETRLPYFNRTAEHYFSHLHSPSSGRKGYPAATRKGRVIYFAHPVFTQYADNAPIWCRQFVLNALAVLLPAPVVRVSNGPTSLQALFNEQAAQKRRILHLLHYIPERKGSFDVIEQAIPLRDLQVVVQAAGKPNHVRLVPQQKPLSFRYDGHQVKFTVPLVDGHQIIEIS